MFSRELRENCTKAGTQLLHLEYHDLNDALLSQITIVIPSRSAAIGEESGFRLPSRCSLLERRPAAPDVRNYLNIVIPSRSVAIGEESAFRSPTRCSLVRNDVILSRSVAQAKDLTCTT